MAEGLTVSIMEEAEMIRGVNLDYNSRAANRLKAIYNEHSGFKESDCLCTKFKRQYFKKKFFDWYDFR